MVKITNLCIAPGQNAQYIGIGTDLCKEYLAARRVYAIADNILTHESGISLVEVCAEGPMELLSRTDVTQPALFTHAYACYEVFRQRYREEFGEEFVPTISAGASLGEYFALLIAEVFDFETGLRLVKRRGELMHQYGRGKQVAVCLNARQLDELCEQEGVYLSNCNFSEQTVLGGEDDRIEKVIERVSEYASTLEGVKGIKAKPKRLQTSAAFHTPLMEEAKKHFAEAIKDYEFKQPKNLVISNCTGAVHSLDPKDIKRALIEQIDHPVRWWQGIERAVEYLEAIACGEGIRFIEFGGGKPDIEGPEHQKANFGGILLRNRREMGEKGILRISPSITCCINVGTIDKTIKDIKSVRSEIRTIGVSDIELLGYVTNDTERSVLIGILEKYGIRDKVRVTQLRADDEEAIETLRSYVSVDGKVEFPFLEAHIGCESQSVQGYHGAGIEEWISSFVNRKK